ncbi:MAG: SUMF1/EgtB/PvdO family nonheme iron enzyme [Bacteroidetes bacterium]|nr:SUMF1/EgtB/PvdO family nonheme iron enzyme [Bacteroidota bacterium]
MGILWILFVLPALSNGIAIENLALNNQRIQFHLNWENAWRLDSSVAPSNHDAAWIFIKKRNLRGDWSSIQLPQDVSKYVCLGKMKPAFQKTSSSLGIMVFADTNMSGKFETIIAIDLEEDFDTIAEIQVFGIEMVEISKGKFNLGDSSSINTFRSSAQNQPYSINSESAISVGQNNGQLSAHFDSTIEHTYNTNPNKDIPTKFPKGYDAFYSMKYEISQEQYIAFLNTLSYSQQFTRMGFPKLLSKHYEFFPLQHQNSICADLTSKPNVTFFADLNRDHNPNQANDGQNKACNFLSWTDLCAYLDWAGLRPMTEFEFEKICRGPLTSYSREYAWGNASMKDAKQNRNNGETNEFVADTIPNNYGIANHGTYNPAIDNGVLRCGYAAGNTTDRKSAGSAYYGVMEMSGNAWEQCINISDDGLQFTGSHGDGALTNEGNASNLDWQPITGTGSGVKGGGWNSGVQYPYNDCAVSDRAYIFQNQNVRRNTVGGRGVIKF